MNVEKRRVAQNVHEKLMSRIANGGSVADHFDAIVQTVTSIIPYDGAAGWIGGDFIAQGSTPTEDQFTGLSAFLAASQTNSVFHTD